MSGPGEKITRPGALRSQWDREAPGRAYKRGKEKTESGMEWIKGEAYQKNPPKGQLL